MNVSRVAIHFLQLDSDRLLIVGGYFVEGDIIEFGIMKSNKETYIYTFSNDSWELAGEVNSNRRMVPACGLIGGRAVVVSGSMEDDGKLSFEVYNETTKVWTQRKTDFTESRTSHQLWTPYPW